MCKCVLKLKCEVELRKVSDILNWLCVCSMVLLNEASSILELLKFGCQIR